MLASLRFAFRALRRSPGFSVLAVLILTLGIGATTAMFSITRTVLLKPLAYRDPARLVTIQFSVPQFSKLSSTVPVNAQHYQLWRDRARTIAEVGLLGPDSRILSGRGESVQVSGARVSANFFHLLGVQPIMGRSFSKGEDQAGRAQVVVISHRFWQEKLGGRRDALGQKLLLDGKPFQVIGAMPTAFPFPRGRQLSDFEQLPEHADYWTPLVFSKNDLEAPLGNMDYLAIARLKPGTTPARALSEMNSLEKVIAKTFPAPVEIDPVVRPLQQAMARDVRLPLLVLMGAVGAVLLIVCINLMNLMMVRATAQRREWAIRLAVGAAMKDILRGAFLESLLLALAGGALGSLLAAWLLQLVRLKAPIDLPRVDELQLDPASLGFVLLVSLGSALLFGLWPGWRAARVDPQEALQSSGRTTSEGRQGQRAGKILVALEVALSTVLLLSAGLLVRSFAAILRVNPGTDVQHVLTMRINLPPEKYQQDARIHSFYCELQNKASSIPGVRAAGLVSDLPLTGENNENPVSAGDRAAPPLTEWQLTNYRSASTAYFKAAGIPLQAGSVFKEHAGDITEVVISENVAARLWPHESAIGKPLRIFGSNLFNVVGVVGSVHAASLEQSPTMMVYVPDWRRDDRDMSLVVRTQNEPNKLSAAIRKRVVALEPEAAIPKIETMSEVVAASVAPQRFQVILLGAFALAALLLACLGIYGVLAFATGRRTAEFGIRMALGARPAQILRSTLSGGMVPVLLGITTGLLASAALARVIQNLLFQVHALDPVMYLGTAALLILVAALACFVPARRAARLDPMTALRHD